MQIWVRFFRLHVVAATWCCCCCCRRHLHLRRRRRRFRWCCCWCYCPQLCCSLSDIEVVVGLLLWIVNFIHSVQQNRMHKERRTEKGSKMSWVGRVKRKGKAEWNGMECKISLTAIAILLDAMDKANLHVSSGIKRRAKRTHKFYQHRKLSDQRYALELSVYCIDVDFQLVFRLFFSHFCCLILLFFFVTTTSSCCCCSRRDRIHSKLEGGELCYDKCFPVLCAAHIHSTFGCCVWPYLWLDIQYPHLWISWIHLWLLLLMLQLLMLR